MKRILIYLALVVSVAVLAQQQLASLQDQAEGGAGNNEQAADASADESTGSETQPGQEASEESTEAAPAANEDTQDGEANSVTTADGEDPDPGQQDSDFEPTEEISEDYPVPLTSDI